MKWPSAVKRLSECYRLMTFVKLSRGALLIYCKTFRSPTFYISQRPLSSSLKPPKYKAWMNYKVSQWKIILRGICFQPWNKIAEYDRRVRCLSICTCAFANTFKRN